jgi:hypothetical protein
MESLLPALLLLTAEGLSVQQWPMDSPTAADPRFSLTLLYSWELDWAYWMDDLSGLDFNETTGFVWLTSQSEDYLLWVTATDPTEMMGVELLPGGCNLPMDPATTGSGAGRYIYVNDGVATDIFCLHGGSWSVIPGNPAGSDGTGMDLDGAGSLWEADTQGHVLRFVPGGSDPQVFDLQSEYVDPCGLTLFPCEGQTGVAVTYHSQDAVEFYLFAPPTSWEYIGSAQVPGTYDGFYGLEYVSDRDSFYMLAEVSGDHWILEMGSDVTGMRSDTWAGIKTLF